MHTNIHKWIHHFRQHGQGNTSNTPKGSHIGPILRNVPISPEEGEIGGYTAEEACDPSVLVLGVNIKKDRCWGWRMLFLSDKERERVKGEKKNSSFLTKSLTNALSFHYPSSINELMSPIRSVIGAVDLSNTL